MNNRRVPYPYKDQQVWLSDLESGGFELLHTDTGARERFPLASFPRPFARGADSLIQVGPERFLSVNLREGSTLLEPLSGRSTPVVAPPRSAPLRLTRAHEVKGGVVRFIASYEHHSEYWAPSETRYAVLGTLDLSKSSLEMELCGLGDILIGKLGLVSADDGSLFTVGELGETAVVLKRAPDEDVSFNVIMPKSWADTFRTKVDLGEVYAFDVVGREPGAALVKLGTHGHTLTLIARVNLCSYDVETVMKWPGYAGYCGVYLAEGRVLRVEYSSNERVSVEVADFLQGAAWTEVASFSLPDGVKPQQDEVLFDGKVAVITYGGEVRVFSVP